MGGLLDEFEDQRDDERVDGDGLGERDAEDHRRLDAALVPGS